MFSKGTFVFCALLISINSLQLPSKFTFNEKIEGDYSECFAMLPELGINIGDIIRDLTDKKYTDAIPKMLKLTN